MTGQRGRPSKYTPELAELVCDQLAEGKSLRFICANNPELPSEKTVRYWALDDVQGFASQYTRAKELQAHTMAEELLEIADDATNDWMDAKGDEAGEGWKLNGEHVARSRLRTDTRKWLLSKMLPKVYGERLDVNSNVRTSTVAAEPMSEDEWNRDHAGAGGGVAPPKGTAT